MHNIPNADNYYITEDGFVYSIKYNRFLNGWVNKTGYLTYVITLNNGKSKRIPSHRLVAKTFLQPVEGKNHVNHIDGDKLNNHHSNLEWCTPAENIRHARDVLGKNMEFPAGKEHHNSKLSDDIVKDIRKKYKTGEHTTRSLGVDYGVAGPTILSVIHNRTWRHVK